MTASKLEAVGRDGEFALLAGTAPSGGGLPAHVHGDDHRVEGGPGTVVTRPKDVRQTFQTMGDTPGRAWTPATPCGFERFFARCAEVFAAASESAPPDMAKIVASSAEHGAEYVPTLGGAGAGQ